MTGTEIRNALTEVHQAVDVPTMDPSAFEAEVRSARRRRTAGRALVMATAVATVAVGASWWAVQSDGPRSVDPAPAAVDRVAAASRPAVVTLEGRLDVIDRSGAVGLAPGIAVEQVVGTTADGVAVLRQSSPGSRLAVVPMGPDGELERNPTEWVDYGGATIVQALLSEDGAVLTTEELDGSVHRRIVGSRDDAVVAHLAAGSQLAAAGTDRWVERTAAGGLLVHTSDAVHELVLDTDDTAAVGRVEVAGPTVAVHTDSGVELFDSDDGSRITSELDGSAGALSRDGRFYASAGERSRVAPYVVEVGSGSVVHLDGLDGVLLDSSVGVSWQDDDRFLVVGAAPERPGTRVLWDCSFALERCDERYSDPTGTLHLPRS